MAAVRFAGVGTAYSGAYIFPTTGEEVDAAPPAGSVEENPVRKLAAAGLTPMLPVTAEVGTFVTAVLARMTYPAAPARSPAVPRSTGAGPAPEGLRAPVSAVLPHPTNAAIGSNTARHFRISAAGELSRPVISSSSMCTAGEPFARSQPRACSRFHR